MIRKPSYDDLLKDVAVLKGENSALRERNRALASRMERFRGIIESISDWIFTHDLNGYFLENNLPFIKDLGYRNDELAGKTLMDLLPSRYSSRVREYLQNIIDNGKAEGIVVILAKDGRELVVEYSSLLVSEDGVNMFVQGTGRDITKRVRAEQALRKNREKYRNIVDHMEEGYYEVDLQGSFTFVNDSLCAVMGFSRSELIGMNIRNCMDEVNARRVANHYRELYRSGGARGLVEFEFLTKRGEVRFLEVSYNLIFDAGKRKIGYRGITRDFTEKRRLETALHNSEKNIKNAHNVTIVGLAKLSEYRDNDAGSHLERIREFAWILARELSHAVPYKGYITEAYIEDIYQSAVLHDIGKVGVPDAILLKPGRLTVEEFEVIKTHSTLGGDAITEIEAGIEGKSYLTLAREIAYHHHEKWDGTGYPDGLAGEDIPLSARIIAVADVYDALTSKRIYKEAYTHEAAVKIIMEESGKQFDPVIVKAFLARQESFNMIRKKMHDEPDFPDGIQATCSTG